MAAASTLRRAAAAAAVQHRTAAAAVQHRTAAVALLRPSATVSGATIHPTPTVHRPFLHAIASLRAPFLGQRRLLADGVVVDKATAEKIMEEVTRIDAAGALRHGATNKQMKDLSTKVIAYTETVSAKSYDKTIDIARTALKVCFLVLVASGFLGGTSFYVIYSAGGAAVSDEAMKLLEQKTEEINRRLEVKLVKMLAELQQVDKEVMESGIKAREASLQDWEERLLAREKALGKKQEDVGKKEVGTNNKKGPKRDDNKKVEVGDNQMPEEVASTKRDGKNG